MESNNEHTPTRFVHVWSRKSEEALCGQPAEHLINLLTLLATYDGPQRFLVCEDCLKVMGIEAAENPT
jgi:hypothetical protein